MGFAVGAIALEGLALYTHAAGHLWGHVPLLGRTDLNRSQDIGLLGVAILVAAGVDAVAGRDPASWPRRPTRAMLPPAALVVVTTGAGLLALRLRHHIALLHGTVAGTGAVATRDVAFELGAATVVVGLLVALVICRPRRARVVLSAALVAAVAASAAVPLRSFDPTVSSTAAYPQTPAVTAVRHLVGTAPTLWLGSSLPPANTNLWFGLGDVGTYDGLDLAWHDQLYDRVLRLPAGGTSPARSEPLPACAEALRVLGVRWVVGAPVGALSLQPEATVGGQAVSPVPGAGTYQLVGSPVVIADAARALTTVASCGFRADRTVVLDGGASPSPSRGGGRGGGVSGHVRVVSTNAERSHLAVRAARPAWLLIRHSWAPGWSATLDGRSIPLRRADVAFQAVAVPAGTHQVVLTYHAPGLRAGSEIAVVAVVAELLLVAAALAGPARVGRRRRRSARHRRRAHDTVES